MSTDIRATRWRPGMVTPGMITPRKDGWRYSYWDAATNIDYFSFETFGSAAVAKEGMRNKIALLNKCRCLNDYIVAASNMSNLDEAVGTIQREIGITDGGYASIHFDTIEETDWYAMNGAERYAELKKYTIAEINFGDMSDSDVFDRVAT